MSKYPNQIDTDAELPGVIDGSTELSAAAINAQKEAILAIERAIGENPEGSVGTLSDRLDVSLNLDGTIKSAALAAAGLATLPLTNSDVSVSAAIEESKLDLDIPTQTLQSQITSNDIDIYALQTAQTSITGTVSTHIAGTAGNHSAADISVGPTVLGAANVQSALEALEDDVGAHRADLTAHSASSITYFAPGATDIDVSNVAEALDTALGSSVDAAKQHFRTAHIDGISIDGYVENEQLFGAVLTTTIYTPIGGNRIIKIGAPNYPTVRSKGISVFSLSPSASNIDIEYWDGYSSRITSVTGLDTSIYPTGTNNRLRGVVASINTNLATDRAPVFAFEDSGELALQHGHEDGYVRILAPVSSAVSALGFSDVVGVFSYSTDTASVVTNGVTRVIHSEIQDGYGELLSPSNTITVEAGTSPNSLIYITNHSSSSGLYQILSVSGTSALLNGTIAAGTYSYRIIQDSVSSGTASAGVTYDLTVDEFLQSTLSSRATITTSQISNVVISKCDLSNGSYSLLLTGGGDGNTDRYLRIQNGTDIGPTATFKNGWLGQVEVIGPGLTGRILVDVRATSISYPATDQFIVLKADALNEEQRIASFWSNGSTTEYSVDLKNSNLTTVTDQSRDGVALFGFDISYDSATVTIGGGRCIIAGRQFDIQKTTLDFSLPTGSFSIWVDRNGVLRVEQVTSANSPANFYHIVARRELPIAYVEASLGVSVAFDCVLFSNDWSNFSISSSTVASCRSLDGGLYLADNLSVSTVKILTSEIAGFAISASDIFIDAGENDLEFVGASILTNCTTKCGVLTASTLNLTDSMIIADSIVASTVSCSGSTLVSDAVSISTDLSFNGQGSGIDSVSRNCVLSLSAGDISISNAQDLYLRNISYTRPALSTPFVALTGTNTGIIFENCSFAQTTAISASDAGSTSLYPAIRNSGTTTDLKILNSSFRDRSAMILNASGGVLSRVTVNDGYLTTSGGLFRNASGASATDVIFDNIILGEQTGTCIFSQGTLTGLIAKEVSVKSHFPTSTSFKMTDVTGTAEGILIENISISDVTTSSDIFASAAELVIDGARLDTVTAGYLFAPQSTYIYAQNIFGSSLNSKLLNGESLRLKDSSLSFSAVAGAPVLTAGSWTDYRITVDNCDITMPTGSAVMIREGWIVNSSWSAGSFEFTLGLTDIGQKLFDSEFISLNTASATAFNFNGLSNGSAGTPAPTLIGGNTFTGSPTTYLMSVTSGSAVGAVWNLYDNELNMQAPASGQAILRIGTAETSNFYFVKNNTLSVGGASIARSLLINDNNVVVDSNKIRATNVTNFIFGASASLTQTGIRIVNNHIFGTNSAQTTNLALGAGRLQGNTGITETYGISCVNAAVSSGTWTVSGAGHQISNSVAGAIYIPIVVPSGIISEVAVDVYASGGIGTVTCLLFEQTENVAAPNFKGTASNTIGSSVQTITITPSSFFMLSSRSLLLKISTTTISNVFGNIRVKVQL